MLSLYWSLDDNVYCTHFFIMFDISRSNAVDFILYKANLLIKLVYCTCRSCSLLITAHNPFLLSLYVFIIYQVIPFPC